MSTTAIGHYQPFQTHRLEAAAEDRPESATCPAVVDGNAHPAQYPQIVAAAGNSQISWSAEPDLRLRRVADQFEAGPLWFVQTDKNVLPNHGFLNRKPFWCFVEHSLERFTRR